MSGIGSPDAINLLIMGYIIQRAEEVQDYPRVPIAEIAVYLNIEMQEVITRLRKLEKDNWIIMDKHPDPLNPLFMPADKVHHLTAKIVRSKRKDKRNQSNMLP